MNITPQQLYHVYNQGNNRQQIFYSEDDYSTFKNYIKKLIVPFAEIIAYCLMPNHFHLLLYSSDNCNLLVKQGSVMIGSISNGFRKLLSGYCRIFNTRYNRSGSLFRQKTKAKNIGNGRSKNNVSYTCEEYCCNCFNYIHENPVSANLVKSPSEWKWSSYQYYAGQLENDFGNKELAKKYCGFKEGEFQNDSRVTNKWIEIIEEDGEMI